MPCALLHCRSARLISEEWMPEVQHITFKTESEKQNIILPKSWLGNLNCLFCKLRSCANAPDKINLPSLLKTRIYSSVSDGGGRDLQSWQETVANIAGEKLTPSTNETLTSEVTLMLEILSLRCRSIIASDWKMILPGFELSKSMF